MAIRVNSENLNQKRKIDLSRIDRIARTSLRLLGKKNAELNIVFLNNQAIRAFNRKYLKRDRSTDVIAFIPGVDPIKGKGGVFLGDIAISTDKALKNSKVYSTSFTEETALYVIHGVLHLLGYKDDNKKNRDSMRRKEDELLQKVRKILHQRHRPQHKCGPGRCHTYA